MRLTVVAFLVFAQCHSSHRVPIATVPDMTCAEVPPADDAAPVELPTDIAEPSHLNLGQSCNVNSDCTHLDMGDEVYCLLNPTTFGAFCALVKWISIDTLVMRDGSHDETCAGNPVYFDARIAPGVFVCGFSVRP
jgi:hypothetical protein